MYAAGFATTPRNPLRSDRALRHLYRWALVVVAALAVMLALSRAAQGGGADATVVVQPGDTLWTIAAQRYPGDDTRARIDDIERLNNLSSPVIEAGETLRLPAQGGYARHMALYVLRLRLGGPSDRARAMP